MTKPFYAVASVLVFAALHGVASAQGESELMQQWLNSHCQVNSASPVCHQVIIRKQPVGRRGTFHPYTGPIDLCPPPESRLDPRDGCVEVGLSRIER